MIRLASLSIISASVSSRYGRINYRRCRAEPAKQFSPEAGRLPGPIEAYRSPHLEYSIPLAIFRNGYSIFTMVDKRTGEPRVEKKKNSRSAAYEVLANIQRLKGGCCLDFAAPRKKEAHHEAYLLTNCVLFQIYLEISPPVNIFDGDVTRIIENLISLWGKFEKFLYIYE